MANTHIYEELGEGPWRIEAKPSSSGIWWDLEIRRRDPDASRIVLQFESLGDLESFARTLDHEMTALMMEKEELWPA